MQISNLHGGTSPVALIWQPLSRVTDLTFKASDEEIPGLKPTNQEALLSLLNKSKNVSDVI